MRAEPRWLGKTLVLALHDLLIVEHGGLPGLRDEGLLDAALARPRNLWVYGEPDEFALAARYAVAIAKNAGVRDNPRIALMNWSGINGVSDMRRGRTRPPPHVNMSDPCPSNRAHEANAADVRC